jgi:putative phosphoribosyl transferase
MKVEENVNAPQESTTRKEVGQVFAGRLLHYADDPDGIVLTLPNGSLAIASVVRKMLQIPMDVFVARTLCAPCNCHCTIGAVTENGVVYMDQDVIARQECPHRELRAHIEREIQSQQVRIARQLAFLRSGRELPNLIGRHVLFLDDGTAPSVILFGVIQALRRLRTGRLVVAIPLGTHPVVQDIKHRVDELIVPSQVSSPRLMDRRYTESNLPNAAACLVP